MKVIKNKLGNCASALFLDVFFGVVKVEEGERKTTQMHKVCMETHIHTSRSSAFSPCLVLSNLISISILLYLVSLHFSSYHFFSKNLITEKWSAAVRRGRGGGRGRTESERIKDGKREEDREKEGEGVWRESLPICHKNCFYDVNNLCNKKSAFKDLSSRLHRKFF